MAIVNLYVDFLYTFLNGGMNSFVQSAPSTVTPFVFMGSSRVEFVWVVVEVEYIDMSF